MTENDLRKFDKEVLVQLLWFLTMFDGRKTLDQLRHQQRRLRYKKLSARREKLLERIGTDLTDAESEIADRTLRRIQRQMNKLLEE